MLNQKIRIRLKGFDGDLVDKSAVSIVQAVKKLGSIVSGPIPLPTKMSRYTVLKSPYVHKKSREQFEMRVYKRLIDIHSPSGEVIESLTKLQIPAGVHVEMSQ